MPEKLDSLLIILSEGKPYFIRGGGMQQQVRHFHCVEEITVAHSPIFHHEETLLLAYSQGGRADAEVFRLPRAWIM